MAEIHFAIKRQNNLQGSGLGFYGSTFGSSVQIGSYQDSTSITNGDGTSNGGGAYNTKFVNFASGDMIDSSSLVPDTYLLSTNGYTRTLDVVFSHDTPVNVQNVQLRIYDRFNKDYPASGVNTKVAELINFYAKDYPAWVSAAGSTSTQNVTIGSGDMMWWGSEWDSDYITQNYFQNSSGIKFYNGQTGDTAVNGDIRITAVGGDESVGGTGLVVPLTNSPGSGGKFMNTNPPGDGSLDGAAATYKPKWLQYYNTGKLMTAGMGSEANDTAGTYGGTGIDTWHTWRVALSATPLTIGSKTKYGLYVSLEYL